MIIFGVSAFISSCEKDDYVPASTINTNNLTTKDGPEWGLNKEWIPLYEHCCPPAVDCFDAIVIHGIMMGKTYDKLINYTVAGKSELFFQNEDWTIILSGLSKYPDYLEKLRKGTVKLKYIKKTETFPGYYDNGKFAFALSFIK